MREERRTFADGNVMITRSISHGGRSYMVMYTRLAPQTLAKLNAKDATPSEAVGDSFLASFSLSEPGSQ
jgi:hypothetical protein